jgi:hypothetical protein
MKTILAVIASIFISTCASQAAIDGFFYKGAITYTVPAGKIVVIQQVSYSTSETLANRNITVNSTVVSFPNATNGLYTLSKALFLPAGSTLLTANSTCVVFGVIIDTSDAPLFVGGGSSLGNVTFANNTLTGELQLSSTAATKVIIQSSTNLVDWSCDSSVVLRRGTDKTKVSFAVPASGPDHFYRGLVRRINAG